MGKKKDEFIWRIVDGETIFLNTLSGEWFSLNKTATRIWALLVEGKTAEEISTTIAGEFKTNVASVSSDVSEFISSIKERGILGAKPG